LNINIQKEIDNIKKDTGNIERRLNHLYMKLDILEKNQPKNMQICFVNENFEEIIKQEMKISIKNEKTTKIIEPQSTLDDGFTIVSFKKSKRLLKKR
jgi:hypothetical protein